MYLSKQTFFAFICLVMTILVALSWLPHNKYIRYQMLDVGAYKAATWIYERIYFDETPIDIAFFGTSHTMNAIDSEIVESLLNNKHVVNFAIPHFGRDMHHTLIKLLLANRVPEVIVLEVRENEARDLHPGVHYLADIDDLYSAPLIVNFRYLGNLIRQPLRQLKAISYEQFPEFFGMNINYQNEHYIGSHLNHALSWPGGELRDNVINPEKIDSVLVKETYSNNNSNALAEVKSFLEHNANLSYIDKIISLAKEKNVELFFLYLPSYGMPDYPEYEHYYKGRVEILKPNVAILRQKRIWSDLGHLNAKGAKEVSVNISLKLEKIL